MNSISQFWLPARVPPLPVSKAIGYGTVQCIAIVCVVKMIAIAVMKLHNYFSPENKFSEKQIKQYSTEIGCITGIAFSIFYICEYAMHRSRYFNPQQAFDLNHQEPLLIISQEMDFNDEIEKNFQLILDTDTTALSEEIDDPLSDLNELVETNWSLSN